MIPDERYETKKMLGEGTYGKVFLARDKMTDADVAIKKIKTGSQATAGSESAGFHFTSIREIKVMRAVSHVNLVTLLDLYAVDSQLCLVMPYLPLDLKQVIADRSVVLSMAHVKCIVRQILSGLSALHSAWFLHRDLSPANILVDPHSGTCKLADFGLSRSFGSPYPGLLGRRRTFGGVMTSAVVTLWYRAPELLFGSQHYGAAVDIWAVGCLWAELMPRAKSGSVQLRQALFPGQSEVDQLQKIFELLGTPSEVLWREAVNFPKFMRFTHLPPPDTPWPRDLFPAATEAAPDTDTLMQAILSLDPNNRPSADELLRHDYFGAAPKPCSEAALSKQVFAFVSR